MIFYIKEYAGNYIYKNGVLEFFNHSEGIVEKEADGYKYVYQYKDHLGNIRLSYKDFNKDGAITQDEIVQEKNYYPFGLQHEGYNTTFRGRNHNYGYNGIELNEDLGLDIYEMPLRQYDPTIARWTSIDPVTHHSNSTYNGFDNNPVFWADPSGANGECSTCDEQGRQTIVNGRYVLRDQRGERQDGSASSEDSNNSSIRKEEFTQQYPVKIDLSNKNLNEVLNSAIEWAIYIKRNQSKENKEKILLSDIVKNISAKGRTAVDIAEEALSGSSIQAGNNKVVIRDGKGNSLTMGYLTGYYTKKNSSSEIIDVYFRGQMGNSNDYRIKFISHKIYGNSNHPTLFYMNFVGEDFYNIVRERIKEGASNSRRINKNLDGKRSGNFIIPIEN